MATGDAARNRLTDMVVQEVSLVDKAANRTTFAVRKRDGEPSEKNGMATTKRDAGEKIKALKALVTKLALKLPKAAKQSIMDGLAEALDKLTALATMIGDAEEDDAAAVPPELVAALTDCGEQIEGIATQFGAPPDDAAPAQQAPTAQGEVTPPPPDAGTKRDVGKAVTVTKAELDAYTAAKVTLDAASSKLWDITRLMTEDPAKAGAACQEAAAMVTSAAAMLGGGGAAPEQMAAAGKALAVAKDLPKEFHDGDGMKPELHDGDSLSQLLRKSLAEGNLLVGRVEKAGRKMAKDRYAKLAGLHDALGKLLNELAFDDGAEKAGAAAKPETPPGPGAKKPKPDEPAQPAEAAKSEDVVRLEKAIADGNVAQEMLAKRLDDVAKAAGGGPAGAAVGEGAARPTESWPLDMSADLASRRRQRANGTAG